MEEKYTYTCSDSNFSAYLQYLGYEYELKVVEKDDRKPKVIFLFEGDSQKEFDDISKSYRFDEIKLNLSQFVRFKDDTFRVVRQSLDEYYNNKKIEIIEKG